MKESSEKKLKVDSASSPTNSINSSKINKTNISQPNTDLTTNKKKKGTDIDALFSKIKKTKQKVEAANAELQKLKVEAPKVAKNIDDDLGLNKKGREYTEEGFPIYSVEELKLGQGGDTTDCPFDCWCCF